MAEISRENEQEAEFASLVERITNSDQFEGADEQRRLLGFLFENRKMPIEARDIEVRHFGYGMTHRKHNSAHSRERIKDLRMRLSAYELGTRGERFRCDITTKSSEGYQLIFSSWFQAVTALEAFWKTNLYWNQAVTIICDSLLFFYDVIEHKAFRYVNTNVDKPDRERAREELRRLHPESFAEHLIPGHLYVDVGTVQASELLRKSLTNVLSYSPSVQLTNDFRSEAIQNSSVILLGNGRTNPFIREFLRSSDSHRLAFRLDQENIGAVIIRDPTDSEIAILGGSILRSDEFGTTIKTETGLPLGVVTRAPNPTGRGTITILSSDATMNISKMAEYLTDERRMNDVFRLMGWSRELERPPYFELLFQTRLWPGGLYDQATDAELIGWR
jgi:hypothetical protein